MRFRHLVGLGMLCFSAPGFTAAQSPDCITGPDNLITVGDCLARQLNRADVDLNEAYQNMGHPGGDVDVAVKQALDLLLATPVVKGPVMLEEGAGARWAYADPNIERLTMTQKQVVRMGPVHTDALLVWLRALKAGLE